MKPCNLNNEYFEKNIKRKENLKMTPIYIALVFDRKEIINILIPISSKELNIELSKYNEDKNAISYTFT